MDTKVNIDSNKYHMLSSTTDSNGVIIDANNDFCEISSFSREELIGSTHNILRHPDMPKSIFKDLWVTLRNNKTWKGIIKNLDRNGNYYWVRATVSPSLDKDKNVTYTSIRIPIDDITIEEYEEKYRKLLIIESINLNSRKIESKKY
jgi:aerotaxis receptor